MRVNLVGARRRASKSGFRGGGSRSGERRKGELWNEKKNYERVRFFEWISWQYLQHLKSYNAGCHLRTNKLHGVDAFELIQCMSLLGDVFPLALLIFQM